MSIMNLYENNVISIITNYINNYKKKIWKIKWCWRWIQVKIVLFQLQHIISIIMKKKYKNKLMLMMNSSEKIISIITKKEIMKIK